MKKEKYKFRCEYGILPSECVYYTIEASSEEDARSILEIALEYERRGYMNVDIYLEK